MGTRALVKVKDREGNTLVAVYRQYDGYPEALGMDLCRIVGKRRLCNGLVPGEEHKYFNGMSELAAVIVTELKGSQHGNVYIELPTTADAGQAYTYYVRPDDVNIRIEVADEGGGYIFEGSRDQMLEWIAKGCE